MLTTQTPPSEPTATIPEPGPRTPRPHPEAAPLHEHCGRGPTDPEAMPLSGVEEELCALSGQIAAATCRFLVLLADFDARQGWAGVNVRSCAHWLSWRCGLDLRTAREHLRVARSLARLPLLREVFTAGRVSYSKVRAIARVGTPENEADLVEAALHSPAAQVERLTRGLRTAAKGGDPEDDPSGSAHPDPRSTPVLGAQWRWDIDGALVLWGRFSPEDGARLLAALTRAETERLRTEEPRTTAAEAREGDQLAAPDGSAEPSQSRSPHADSLRPPSEVGPALVAMAEMVCSASTAPIQAPAAEVIVIVDADTLLGALAETADGTPASAPSSAGPRNQDPQGEQAESSAGRGREAHLENGPALYAASLRRLADDGRLRAAVVAGDGRTLNLGRARRTVSAPQFITLWRRDHGCTVPGCGRIRFLHAHHVVFWARGGRTDLDNLVLLCGDHHRALHDGAFTIQAHGEQRFTFHNAVGTTTYQASPPVAGRLEDISSAYRDIGPDAITPDWDGSPLYLDWAVGGYLDAWAARERHARTAAV